MTQNLDTIVFGGGCFWCTEAVFVRVPGVKSVVSGYAGGETQDPNYESICGGRTGHAEVIKIEYDPAEVSLVTLLEIFFAAHDPTTLNRQGNDVGTQYRSVVFYSSESQKEMISKFIPTAQKDFQNPIVTEVSPLEKFYSAETYHQKYYDSNIEAPYCQFVISPKLQKVKEKFDLNMGQP